MKTFTIAFITLLFSLAVSGQQPSRPKNYTLKGERHGINYFPLVRYSQVEYTAGDTLKFNKYHSADVIVAWMRKWAEKYPEIAEVYDVGRSFEGRPIYQMTVTNKKTGKDTEKPAAFFEGGRHSGEVTASETVMWMAKYLIENYGKDPEVTALIDKNAIYLRPINNPDGHNLYMNSAQSNRSTVRPDDNEGDGLLDEDAPDDIDGNGVILTMRWKDEKNGTLIPDPRDTTGRIMKRVPAGKGIWATSSEGIDNDNDGRVNEDGIGGLDLHRNYPENWRPDTEFTERGYTQGGAGEYPLSETETRAVVTFLLSHPNVYIVNSMDTSVPMHLRPPSTSASEERMYPEDLSWYRTFDEIGKKITGYEKAGDVFIDYGGGSPLFGHGPDFGYFQFGAIWYGDEIWNGARNKDYDGDGTIDQLDMIKWDDAENDSLGFFDWKPAKHPVYGDVETGGFDPKFFSQNPPAKHLEKWARNEAMFNIEMMKYLPALEWDNVEIKKVKSYKADSADYQLKVTYRNTGKLPTALKQAALVKIVNDDKVIFEFTSRADSSVKTAYIILDSEKGKTPRERLNGGGFFLENPAYGRPVTKVVPFTLGGDTGSATVVIRVYKNSSIEGKARVLSTRGGLLKDRSFKIETPR
jgi:hypothetical protein